MGWYEDKIVFWGMDGILRHQASKMGVQLAQLIITEGNLMKWDGHLLHIIEFSVLIIANGRPNKRRLRHRSNTQ